MSVTKAQDEMIETLTKLFGGNVKSVELYGGEFDEKEIDFKSFVAPAIFLAPLGWQPAKQQESGVRTVDAKFAIFCVAQSARGRIDRMLSAEAMAERISWRLSNSYPCIGHKIDGVTAENLFNRKLDQQSQAIWSVSYWQRGIVIDRPADLPAPPITALKTLAIQTNIDGLRGDVQQSLLP